MIKDNTKTQMAKDQIQFAAPDDWEDDNLLFDSTEYALTLAARNPVLEGIVDHLKKQSFAGNTEDRKQITKEINKRYVAMGLESGIPRAVRNWLSGTPCSPSNRENLYNLCLALGLNLDETREFFLKNFMTIPFNYKDRVDAIYYYGLNHSMTYINIKALLDELNNDECLPATEDMGTEAIGGFIADIESIDKFKEYIKNNTFSQKEQNNTACENVNALITKNADYAELERCIRDDGLEAEVAYRFIDESGEINRSGLLKWVYGYSNQKYYSEHKQNIAKSMFLPKAFTENFPKDMEMTRVLDREASSDGYRKALVIMKFYNYYAYHFITFVYGTDAPNNKDRKKRSYVEYFNRNDEEIEEDFDDFYIETSKLLAKCGFEQMYFRNPFDWLILYCAKSTDPLTTFRALLETRFTERNEEGF